MIHDVLSQIDYLAVVFAAVAGVIVGAIWYLPGTFGSAWKTALGVGAHRRPVDPKVVVVVRGLATVVTAFSLALLLVGSGATTLGGALRLGLVVSLGVVVTTVVSDYLFAGWSTKLIAITAGHRFLHIMVMCAVLGAYKYVG